MGLCLPRGNDLHLSDHWVRVTGTDESQSVPSPAKRTLQNKGFWSSHIFRDLSQVVRRTPQDTLLATPNLVNLFLIKLVRISGFSSLFLAIAVYSAHFAREC